MKLGEIAIHLEGERHLNSAGIKPEHRIVEHMRQKPDTQFSAMC